jgi:hypothetical protein
VYSSVHSSISLTLQKVILMNRGDDTMKTVWYLLGGLFVAGYAITLYQLWKRAPVGKEIPRRGFVPEDGWE